MPQTCKICKAKNRKAIEKAIVSGVSLRDIARQFKVSKDGVSRHKRHIKSTIIQAAEKRMIKAGKSYVERFEALVEDAEKSLKTAKTDSAKQGWHHVLGRYLELAYKLGMEEARRKEQQQFKDVTPAVLAIINKEFERG
jgi:hypothetical protein